MNQDRPSGLLIDKVRASDLVSEAMLEELEIAEHDPDADQALYTAASDTARLQKEAEGAGLIEGLAALSPEEAVEVLAEFAGEHFRRLASDPYGLRRHFLLTAAAMSPKDDGDDVQARAAAPLTALYGKQADRTAKFYSTLLAAADLRVRPPFTLEEVSHHASSLCEGLLLHYSGDPEFSLDDGARQFSQAMSLFLSIALAPPGDSRDLASARSALFADTR